MPIVQPNARETVAANVPQRGGIVNPNGTVRKNAPPVKGNPLQNGLASRQHGTTVVHGTSYNSPFTSSGSNLFSGASNNSTMVNLPALQVESPGKVVKASDYVKVHPSSKGTFFTPKAPASRPVAFRNGGPSPHANVPSNPNVQQPSVRPVRKPDVSSERIAVQGSFLTTNRTLGAHPHADIGQSRMSMVKKGVV